MNFENPFGQDLGENGQSDNLCQELDQGSASLLILLDFSVGFDTIIHVAFLEYLARMGLGSLALQWL